MEIWRNSNGESVPCDEYTSRPPRKDKQGRTYYQFSKRQFIDYAVYGGADVNIKDKLGRTPLMFAITNTEDVFVINYLLSKNADIYTTDFQGMSALKWVIDQSKVWLSSLKPTDNQLTILSMFFERVKNDFYIDRVLTLQRLQSVGCPKALVPFINCNQIRKYLFDINSALEERLNGLTALHVAVISQDIVSFKILLDRGEDINAVDSCKQTALFAHDPLAEYGSERFSMLEILLNRGVSLYKPRNDGITPLEFLLKYGRERTIETVLESNANFLDKCIINGETALHFIVQNKNLNDVSRIIRLLFRRGFDENAPDDNGMSALTYAIKYTIEKMVWHLLKVGVKANWIEIVERTPMLDIFMNDYCEKEEAEYYQWVVKLILMQQGINIQDLFNELNEGLVRQLDNLFCGQIVIAQLVIAEATGQHIPDSTLEYIKSKSELNVHYEICKERLEQLKTITVCDSLNLYQLLTESDDVIEECICNKDFLTEFKYVMGEQSYENLYYVVVTRKRMENALRIVELRKKADRIVSECTGLYVIGISKNHPVVHKIVSYLSNRDVQNLFDGQLSIKDFARTPPIIPKVKRNIFSRAIRKFFARIHQDDEW